jgi:hypothetical protein
MKTSTLAIAGVVAAVIGLVWYEKEKSAAAATTPPTLPGSANVALQPGATTVAVSPGGQVTLTLPAGASWAALNPVSPVQAVSTPPTGNQTYTLVMSTVAGTTPITASWVDSTGTAQLTTVNVAVS